MTAMLASVTGPQEAEIAIAGGADIIDLKDPAAGAFAALPLARIIETLTAIKGRRPSSAVTGDAAMQPDGIESSVRDIASTGVDYVKIGLFPPQEKKLATIRKLAEAARTTRLVACLFIDREPEPTRLIPAIAEAGFAGVMLDTADKAKGRLTTRASIATLSAFVKAAKERALMVGLAGGLEPPDVPRLLSLQPDFLGFRGALCAVGGREAGLDVHAVAAIRKLIPMTRSDAAGKVDYRLLSMRGFHPGSADPSQTARVYIRDLVLPVRIGAYSHERSAPQKVRFDVSVDVPRPRSETQAMGQVYSYDLITDAIQRIIAEEHIDFVETLAERIGTAVLQDPRVARVTLKVEKIEIGPGGVGVELTMDRSAQAEGENPILAMLENGGRETS